MLGSFGAQQCEGAGGALEAGEDRRACRSFAGSGDRGHTPCEHVGIVWFPFGSEGGQNEGYLAAS